MKIVAALYVERTATSKKVQFERTMDEATTNFFPGGGSSTRHSRLRRTRAGHASQCGSLPYRIEANDEFSPPSRESSNGSASNGLLVYGQTERSEHEHLD
jgi:hypothetical protein